MCVIADRPLHRPLSQRAVPVPAGPPLSESSRDCRLTVIFYLFIMHDTLSPPSTMQHHPNTSEYTLDTVHDTDPLLQDDTPLYGSTQPRAPSPARLLLSAALRMAALFLFATLVLGGTLFLALPTLEPSVSFSPRSSFLTPLQ